MRVATDEIRGWVHRIVPAGDRVFVVEHSGELWVVERDRETTVPGPDGAPVFGATDILVDDEGVLWVAVDGTLRRRGLDGAWSVRWSTCFGGDGVRQLTQAPSGALHIATDHALWRAPVDVDACPEKSGDARATCDLLITDDGDLHALEISGRWWRFRGEKRELLHTPPMQGRALATRGTDVWAAYSDGLAVARPGRPIEASGSEQGMGRGGPIAVDHEGSLWVATVDGLLQYPEPNTIAYSLYDDHTALETTTVADPVACEGQASTGVCLLSEQADGCTGSESGCTGSTHSVLVRAAAAGGFELVLDGPYCLDGIGDFEPCDEALAMDPSELGQACACACTLLP